MDLKFIVLYAILICIALYDSFMIGIIEAHLNIIEKKLNEED